MDVFEDKRVLIVDDSRTIRRALGAALSGRGALVKQAEDGEAGLQVLADEEFDLVITDVDMPRLNGFDFCERVKQDPRTRNIPVIILTSRENDLDVERGFIVGANAYALKTVGRERCLEVAEDILSRIVFRQRQLVLLIEDSATTRQIIARTLKAAGFQVALAEHGAEALELLRTLHPTLILSDREMPVMNGMSLCRELHQKAEFTGIPFVMMSGSGEKSVMRQAMQFGAAAFLVKPFNLEQLVITLEQLLSSQFSLLLKERERLETESRMMLASITALAEALEARDAYTRGHSDSVAEIAVAIAAQMGADDADIAMLRIGARLHDIGKIGVPDAILQKPGKLTSAEYTAIQGHPAIGAGILEPITSLADIIPIVLQHHERVDGKGYPNGLKGTEIALNARITAVADTYDALTSDRPYRVGLSHGKAVSIILQARGTQLCPECVDAFIAWSGQRTAKAAAQVKLDASNRATKI